MKTKATLIILTLTYSVNAQMSFNKIYTLADAPDANAIYVNNDTLNILSNQNFIRLNNQGLPIDNIKFTIDSAPCPGYYYAVPVSFKENTVVVTSYRQDTLCDTIWSYVTLYNTLNNTKLWERKFKFDSAASVYFAYNSLQQDSDLLIAGNCRKTSPGLTPIYPYFLKFDNNGNLLWLKYFNTIQGAPVTIIQTADGGSILGMNVKDIGATLLKVDSAGNVLWCKSYYRSNSELIKVIEGENGNIYLTGRKDTTNIFSVNFQSSSSFIIKTDAFGIPILGIYYNAIDTATNIQDMIYNPFSYEIVVLGRQYNSTFTRYHFSKFDINGFTNSPSAIYFRNDYYLQVYKIKITSPGSYLIGGNVTNLSSFGANWLCTLDSNGYGMCNGFPGNIGYNSFTPVDSDITVTYTTGATVVASNDIYTTGVQPFTVQDGCLYTGEQAISAANNLLQITPNPANDVFTISVPANAKQVGNLTLSVYDAQGKLILQQQVKSNEKIKMNMKGQHPGIYNVVITDGAIKYSGKLVLQ